ncbi:MAG TPA: hypothetical protein VNT75_02655 [Symbiobacteriaceae bacterium]|nr:hypothetical protein [Symbiobacteriaceae bacterium]
MRKRLLLGLCLLWLCMAIAAPRPALGAAPVLPAEHPWIPISSVPPELLAERFPKGVENGRDAIALVAQALGRRYTWINTDESVPLFFQDSDGTYGYVEGIRLGVVLDGTEAEAQARVARGLFDRIYYVRAKAAYRDGAWQKPVMTLQEPPALPVPKLPAGGPDTPTEAVRGWPIPFHGEIPEPPIGSGLNLADEQTLRPVLEQLALYPAPVILAADSADTNLLISTQMQFQAAVVGGKEACAILIVRTVNGYKRAPWMDPLWRNRLNEVTDRLDDAAKAAGVQPDRVATQRVLLTRGAGGWEVAEARTYQGAYSLQVAPPTTEDRVIGALETVQVIVPARVRDPEPVDPVTDAVATAGATVILVAWASAQLLGRTGRSAQILRQAAGESTGSKLAKMASDALDWLFKPVEKPLERLAGRTGLSRYLKDEPADPPTALRKPGAKGSVCAACGTPVRDDWAHCTGCGARLLAVQVADGAPTGTEGGEPK